MGTKDEYQVGDIVNVVVTGHTYMHHHLQMPNGEIAWMDVTELSDDSKARLEPGEAAFPVGTTINAVVVGLKSEYGKYYLSQKGSTIARFENASEK